MLRPTSISPFERVSSDQSQYQAAYRQSLPNRNLHNFREMLGPDGEHVTQIGEVNGFRLSNGTTIKCAQLSYCVFGQNPANPVIVAHPALTGSARAMIISDDTPKTQGDGWWTHVIGPGKPLDTHKYTVICFDHFGGHYGASTARTLENLGDITLGDGVQLIAKFIKDQGINEVAGVIGGSMGGGQAMEWLFQNEVTVRRLFDISGSSVLTPRSREFFKIQGDLLDPSSSSKTLQQLGARYISHVTDLFDLRSEVLSNIVLRLSNELSQITMNYSERAALSWCRKFGFLRFVTPHFFEHKYSRRLENNDGDTNERENALDRVASWLNDQGEKFVERFSASGLRNLCQMAGGTSDRNASEIAQKLSENDTKLVGFFVNGDILFPPSEQISFYSGINHCKPGTSTYMQINDFKNGHDHFLNPVFQDHARALLEFR